MSDSQHIGHRARLRARYAAGGATGFADHELLELLLTFALPRRDTNGIAHALLDRFGSLSGVFAAPLPELTQVPGIGPTAAILLRLIGDLMDRGTLKSLENRKGRSVLSNPLASALYAVSSLRGYTSETVLAVCLNSRKEVLHCQVIQHGTLGEAQVYPRSVAEVALLRHAHSMLLIHNHPSGNPAPSGADGEVTAAVREALSVIGVQLIDHLVAAPPYVYSFSAGMVIDLSGEAPSTLELPELTAYLSEQKPALKKVMEPYSL